jgi:predicted DNA-binding transcriptional regulator AlpA
MDIMTVTEVCKELKIGRTTLHRARRHHGFPQPVRRSLRGIAFRRDEVEAWVNQA